MPDVTWQPLLDQKSWFICLLTIQASQLNQPELMSEFHSLGASGAVSGIMGIFIVRCFFAQISFSVPLLMIPIPILNFFSFPIRIQAPILVGLFFTFDLAGSVNQYNLSSGHVNYWSHVGGYLTCIVIGILMGLHREVDNDIAKTKSARFRKIEGRGWRCRILLP